MTFGGPMSLAKGRRGGPRPWRASRRNAAEPRPLDRHERRL